MLFSNLLVSLANCELYSGNFSSFVSEDIDFLPAENLIFVDYIGYGKSSKVYEGLLNNVTKVAIKKYKRICDKRYKREIRILEDLQGVPGVVKLYGAFGSRDFPLTVTELCYSKKSSVLVIDDIKWFMKKLFTCLSDIHDRNIFHRDIKLSNILVDFTEKKFRIIDWGLADFYIEANEYSVRVGTKAYKAPELLLGMNKYDQKIDVWSAGIVMAALIFSNPSIFGSKSNHVVLNNIYNFFGRDKMDPLLQESKKTNILDERVANNSKSFYLFVSPSTKHLVTPEVIDFLEKVLNPSPKDRLSSREALEHTFLQSFDDV